MHLGSGKLVKRGMPAKSTRMFRTFATSCAQAREDFGLNHDLSSEDSKNSFLPSSAEGKTAAWYPHERRRLKDSANRTRFIAIFLTLFLSFTLSFGFKLTLRTTRRHVVELSPPRSCARHSPELLPEVVRKTEEGGIKVAQQQTPSCGDEPKKIIFVHYGVLQRARGCVRAINEELVYKPATMNYSVPFEHIAIGIDVEGRAVDGLRIPPAETTQVIADMNYTTLTSLKVSEMDARIEEMCQTHVGLCETPFWRADYYAGKIRRAMRAMYCEQKIADMLHDNIHAYDNTVFVVLSADILVNKAISYRHIVRAHCAPDTVFMTRNNDGPDGYTDGLYVASPKALSLALSTYSVLQVHLDSGLTANPYETLLKKTFLHFGMHLDVKIAHTIN